MAKNNYRQAKKKARQAKQIEYKQKQYQRVKVQQKERKKTERKHYKKDLEQRKINYLTDLGYDKFLLTREQINSIKISDINKNKVNAKTYSFLRGKKVANKDINYSRVYKFPNGKRIYIAYRDYSQENNIEQNILSLDKKSDSELLKSLRKLNDLREKSKAFGVANSNGKAGDVRYTSGDNEVMANFNLETKEITQFDKQVAESIKGLTKEKRKRRYHTLAFTGFQTIAPKGDISYSELTPHKALVLANTIMGNVTDDSRKGFYIDFYSDIIRFMPVMKGILPIPTK